MSSCKGLRPPSDANVHAFRRASVHFCCSEMQRRCPKGPANGGVWQGLGAQRTTDRAGRCSFVVLFPSMLSKIRPEGVSCRICGLSALAGACRRSLSACRLRGQVALLGKRLAAFSEGHKSYSGHLWIFSKHRGKSVCVHTQAYPKSCSWKKCFLVLLFPRKGKI